MLSSIGDSIRTALGGDVLPGLMGMFLFLHFYYGVPTHGWAVTGVGLAVIFTAGVALVSISLAAGNGFRAAAALTMTALALDFFFRGQLAQPATLVFSFLNNGPAGLNFASFGLIAVVLFAAK
ncbi:TPA: hypothetical protein L5D75_006394 [Pseudomonas aeruginosa]|nr:hypothetical protein [Pseudomonas aeruginosa]